MTDSLERFVEWWLRDPTVGKLISATVSILAVVVLVRFMRSVLNRYIQEPGNLYRARKMVTFLGYVIGLLIIALVFSDRLGRMAVAFGVAGAGIAFALQEVIASVAGWVAISFGNFYKTGDRVQVGRIKGDVIDIGMLRTTLMEVGDWVTADLYNGRIVRIANSFVFKEPVFNYSGEFPFLWDELVLPVKYGCDFRLAKAILQRVIQDVAGEYAKHAKASWQELIRQYHIESAELEPQVFLRLTDNWMEFTARYVVDYKRRRSTKDAMFTRILEEIERTDGRVAIASATFHLVEAPELTVRLKESGKDSHV